MASSPTPKDIVIIGGGIIGSTTAYFLTHHPHFNSSIHRITLLEASTIAGGASGKAGGLLALWAYPSQLVPLSYKLHAELAAKYDGARRWGYRPIHCGQLDAKGRAKPKNSAKGESGERKKADVDLEKTRHAALGKLRAAGLPKDLDWVAPDSAESYSEMGSPDTTAQVHPYHFTKAMASMAEEKGAQIREHASVSSINKKENGSAVESVTYTDSNGESHTLPATHVVVAAGPWTGRVLKGAPIAGLRAHSVTIKPRRDVSAYALFTEINLPNDFNRSSKFPRAGTQTVAPEIYARPDEVYACGEGDRLVPLPKTTADVQTDQSRCQDIIDQVGSISDELRDGEVTARQACYLPVSNGASNGGPWIGETKTNGLVLASGHSCWGIQNGPGTGKCVSEVVMEGKVQSAKLGMLEPAASLKGL
ncbi:MAG: hypothetical protein Q9162_000458 [Coniocarpon cinnabarinum]